MCNQNGNEITEFWKQSQKAQHRHDICNSSFQFKGEVDGEIP